MLRIDCVDPGESALPDPATLDRLLRLCFEQRRKQIGSAGRRRNSPFEPERFAAALAKASVAPADRPEQVAPEAFAAVAAELARGR